MTNNDNTTPRFIYIHKTKQKIPCTEQQYRDFYRFADAIRKKEEYNQRCKCTKQFIWSCDGDCENCEHHLGYGELSLDAPNTEEGMTFLYSDLDKSVDIEDILDDQVLLGQLFQRFRELDSNADEIINMKSNGFSDRKIAEALGRKQRTFADQMKKIRNELRKLRDK